MLVLSRRVNEVIKIDGGISVKILKFNGTNSVSIGIEAPENVEIWRQELTDNGASTMRKKAVKKVPKHPTQARVNRSKPNRTVRYDFDENRS